MTLNTLSGKMVSDITILSFSFRHTDMSFNDSLAFEKTLLFHRHASIIANVFCGFGFQFFRVFSLIMDTVTKTKTAFGTFYHAQFYNTVEKKENICKQLIMI